MLLTRNRRGDLEKCAWLSLESANLRNWGEEWVFDVPERLRTRTASFNFGTGTMYITPQLKEALKIVPCKCLTKPAWIDAVSGKPQLSDWCW